MESQDKLYVGGKWVDPVGSQRILIINPSTEEEVFSVPESEPADIDSAVAAARDLHVKGEWTERSFAERVTVIGRFADELAVRAEWLTSVLAREMGAPISRGTEVPAAVALTRFYCSIAETLQMEERRSGAFRPSLVDRVPVGVVAAVVPWNAPIYLAVGKLVPALLAGCPVVLKPAPETSFSAYSIAEAVDAAGFPPGLVSVLPAGRTNSEYLVAHTGIDKVSFTGSTVTGRKVAALAVDRLKRFSLELGGKSAGIVMPDADIGSIMPAVVNGTMANTGQVCALLSRLLVPRKLADDFVDAYTSELSKIVVGDPLDPTTEMGPLVAKRQLDRVLDYVQAGKDEGARIVQGGSRPSHLEKGWFVEPTVFVDVDNSMRIAREEIFGPVITVLTYDTVDDAVAVANDSEYGLSGAVFGSDQESALAVARRLLVGTATVNTSIDFDFDMPFGGFRQSGLGREYGGIDGILNYTETRAIGL